MNRRIISLIALILLTISSAQAGSFTFNDIVKFPTDDNTSCQDYPDIINSTHNTIIISEKTADLSVTLKGIYSDSPLNTTFVRLGTDSTGIVLTSYTETYYTPQILIKIRKHPTNRKDYSCCFFNIKIERKKPPTK